MIFDIFTSKGFLCYHHSKILELLESLCPRCHKNVIIFYVFYFFFFKKDSHSGEVCISYDILWYNIQKPLIKRDILTHETDKLHVAPRSQVFSLSPFCISLELQTLVFQPLQELHCWSQNVHSIPNRTSSHKLPPPSTANSSSLSWSPGVPKPYIYFDLKVCFTNWTHILEYIYTFRSRPIFF